MSREEMISVLVCDSLERIIVSRQTDWLRVILEKGFSGFSRWSDERLIQELCRRDLDVPSSYIDDAGDLDGSDVSSQTGDWGSRGLLVGDRSRPGVRDCRFEEHQE